MFEDNFILCTYLFYTGQELARLLNRHVGSVFSRLRYLGFIIPLGMVVAFRDRNTLNCDIENLYLLSKKENMLRNQIHQYPDDLKQVIHTISKLTKQIKRYAEK